MLFERLRVVATGRANGHHQGGRALKTPRMLDRDVRALADHLNHARRVGSSTLSITPLQRCTLAGSFCGLLPVTFTIDGRAIENARRHAIACTPG